MSSHQDVDSAGFQFQFLLTELKTKMDQIENMMVEHFNEVSKKLQLTREKSQSQADKQG